MKYTNTTSQLMYVAQEQSIYGSSRVGVDNRKDTLYMGAAYTNTWGGVGASRRELGLKSFELANHLGNVLVTVSDKPIYKVSSGVVYFNPEVSSISDYYPFGAQMAGRGYSSEAYRFGFNTQEKTDEISGPGNHFTAQFWEYNSRLGRRWNIDPVVKPWESLYACLSDNPILLNDPDGDDPGNPKRYIVVGGDDLTKIGNKYGVSVDNLVKWNNIPKRNEIEIGQSLIVSDPTKVKEPEEFVWFNSANSTFSQPKTVKDPEEYLWWASGNSPRTNSPIINQPFNPLTTTVSNNTENAQGVEGHGNEWVETGFVINNAVDNSLSITTGSIVGAQKLANSVANTTYEVVTEIPVLHNLGRLTGAVSIADNFMKSRQNPSENWWNGVECVGQIGFYFCGGGEAEIIFNLGTMGIDAGIELWNYSTQPQLNSNKK